MTTTPANDIRTRPAPARAQRGFVLGSTEARPGIMTTEFWLSVLGAVVVVIAAYVSDTFDNDLGWILAVSLIATYSLSRGLAKAGSREGPFAASFDKDERAQ
jgi:hypothetical protein